MQTKCLAMKEAALFMKELEILPIPDPKEVLKQTIVQMTSTFKISEKLNVPELE